MTERDRLVTTLRDMGIDTEGVTGYTEAAFWADVADRLIAAGVGFVEQPQTLSRLHGADDKRDRAEGSDNE